MKKINGYCGIGVCVEVWIPEKLSITRRAGERISAVRCLTCGGSEESYGLDSSFCDIAAIGGDTVRPNTSPITIAIFGQAAGRHGGGSARVLIADPPGEREVRHARNLRSGSG